MRTILSVGILTHSACSQEAGSAVQYESISGGGMNNELQKVVPQPIIAQQPSQTVEQNDLPPMLQQAMLDGKDAQAMLLKNDFEVAQPASPVAAAAVETNVDSSQTVNVATPVEAPQVEDTNFALKRTVSDYKMGGSQQQQQQVQQQRSIAEQAFEAPSSGQSTNGIDGVVDNRGAAPLQVVQQVPAGPRLTRRVKMAAAPKKRVVYRLRGAKAHAEGQKHEVAVGESSSTAEKGNAPISVTVGSQMFSTVPVPPVANITQMAKRVRRIVRHVKAGSNSAAASHDHAFTAQEKILAEASAQDKKEKKETPKSEPQQTGVVDKIETSSKAVEAHPHRVVVQHKGSTSVHVEKNQKAAAEKKEDVVKESANEAAEVDDTPPEPIVEVKAIEMSERVKNFEWSWAGVTKFMNEFFLEAPSQN